jgi:hypothetical protein
MIAAIRPQEPRTGALRTDVGLCSHPEGWDGLSADLEQTRCGISRATVHGDSVTTLLGPDSRTVRFICLPDTVDLLEPKGK